MAQAQFQQVVSFIRELYQTDQCIPLHEPSFIGKEQEYVIDCIQSTFVSSVGRYVDRFERMVADYTGAPHAIATVNGTAALHVALMLAGVGAGEEVLTQPLSFIAGCNAIRYCGAFPVFVDVDRDTLGMSADSLVGFLSRAVKKTAAGCINRLSGRRIAAVMPMHTFGLPCHIDALVSACAEVGIPLVEDAAESLGSRYQGRHTGTFGTLAAFSFNGNKTVTTGGGGMVVTGDASLARRGKHITTTAKLPHPYEFVHDEVGYNYRLPNINAALGCAQMEMLPRLLESKRAVAAAYAAFFRSEGIQYVGEPKGSNANYWLNAVILPDRAARDEFIQETNAAGVMSRPIWRLMTELPMFADCQRATLNNAAWLQDRVVNLPSSARIR